MAERTPSAAERWQALGVLLFGAAVIGLSPILVRLADAGPAAAGFWRLAFALPLLLAMTWRTSGGPSLPSRYALAAGVMFSLDLGFWHYGISYTSVTKATVLTNLTPVVVTAFAWIFLKERPRALFLAAVALAVAGAWTMAVSKGAGRPGPNEPLGDALSLTTALWYAFYMLAMGEGRKRETTGRLMFWSGAVGAPLMLAAALLFRERLLPATAGGWAACLGLGLMHVVGQGSIAWAMGRLPTSTASVVVVVQPVVAAVLGWLLFQEILGPLQALGAAVALSGVVLAQLASRPRGVSPGSPAGP
ncbi:DMT family transporter [Phenylobacterium sp.]|uniref:DMT family transporter n=1 Tax=Phenylobacterium sp. TaxID=1871053 RepID=UPI002F927F16